MMGHNTENLTKYLGDNFYSTYEGSTYEVGLEERLEHNQKKQEEIFKEQDKVEQEIRSFPFYITALPAALTAMSTGFFKAATYLYGTLQGRNDSFFSLDATHTIAGLVLGGAYAGLLCFNRVHAGIRQRNLEESLNAYKTERHQLNKTIKEFK